MEENVKLGSHALAAGRGIMLIGGSASKCFSLSSAVVIFTKSACLQELPEICIFQ
jgi:hypothetical protein